MEVWPLDWRGPLEEEWQPTPLFLLEKSHGQRSLAGHSLSGCKELDTTEVAEAHTPFPYFKKTGDLHQ